MNAADLKLRGLICESIELETDRATSGEVSAYLQGATRDGTFNRLHRTLRISQADARWLRVLENLRGAHRPQRQSTRAAKLLLSSGATLMQKAECRPMPMTDSMFSSSRRITRIWPTSVIFLVSSTCSVGGSTILARGGTPTTGASTIEPEVERANAGAVCVSDACKLTQGDARKLTHPP